MDARIAQIMRKIRSPEQATWNTQKIVDESAQQQQGMIPNVGGIPTPPVGPSKDILSGASMPQQQPLDPSRPIQAEQGPGNPPQFTASGLPNLDSLVKRQQVAKKNFLGG